MKFNFATIDIETTGLSRYKCEINYIGIGISEKIGDPIQKYFIFKMPFIEKSKNKFKKLISKLKKDKTKLIWQNGKFDTLFLEFHLGLKLPIHHDVMVMGTAYELATKHGLKDMAQKYLGVENWDISKKEKTSNSSENSEIVKKYLKYDLQYTWELFSYFCDRMNDKHWKIYKELLKPVYLMYRDIERNGIYFDIDKFQDVKEIYLKKESICLEQLKTRYDINWNSPKQVSDVLFNREKLPTLKLSEKTGQPSADAKVLRRLAAQGHEIPQLLLDYKYYYSANSKFLKVWDKHAEFDGRIHPTFHITNVITGRTSCSEPNLQQVPRNPELRSLYTAPEGRVMIEADYSQIELRIAADYANEKNMIKIYQTGGDIHTETAISLTGKKEPSKEDRSKAKAINFGFLYGMQAKGFVNYAFDSYGVVFTLDEAKRYRELFFAKYPALLLWHKSTEIECDMLGGIANRFGRFRALPDIHSSSYGDRSAAARRAINTPVQSTASDLLVASAVEISKKLSKEYDLKIVGTVHDSILMDLPKEYVSVIIPKIQEIMTKPEILKTFNIKFKLPIEVDISVGAWGSK